MGFWGFFWATGLGQLPATIIYSYVGSMLTGGAKTMVVLFALTIVIFVFKQIWQQRSNAKADTPIN